MKNHRVSKQPLFAITYTPLHLGQTWASSMLPSLKDQSGIVRAIVPGIEGDAYCLVLLTSQCCAHCYYSSSTGAIFKVPHSPDEKEGGCHCKWPESHGDAPSVLLHSLCPLAVASHSRRCYIKPLRAWRDGSDSREERWLLPEYMNSIPTTYMVAHSCL